ncbi:MULTISPECIES: hypothetical protein [Methylobacterium]|jgi:hypothetical protein|uniref:Uncharacterized protein n=1 Tax=Methylobacterium brachiatum TaxID=269660 RepID=A0AAJ1WXV8_9HYPH|nr:MULTISPECIES: hypothetical protein [Methylobacterium]EIZ83134.1 hypothetical protein WYO_4244 [Methylobacterium sp. GXF4]MCB4805767.1 hypothetical protein [Methylobacterium brachiatum]MDH2312804.1 hypothetical protein [Methylobacterium brachiatum]MDQ0547004.1 hypothetical protein [Methylobacterium brachiatum]CAA2157469.1 hypothetical protein MBRA_02851 [Methylobacterium brachiatum]
MIAASIRTLLCAALSVALPTALSAQPRAPDQTGTGGGPTSTITAPNTNSLGVTKPPGTSLGPGEVPSRREQRRERALTDKIEDSVCEGCN